MHSLLQDARYALRSLARARAFTLAAILTLALGVGANSTIFTAIDAMWFQSFSFPAGARVVAPFGTRAARGVVESEVAPYEHAAWRESGAFEHLAAYVEGEGTVRLGAEPERARVTAATADLFALLRTRPALGRVFTAEEEVPGREGVAVLSHDTWVRRFGADPAVLGRSVAVDGVARTVVGVLPPGAQFPPTAQLWVPLALTPEQREARTVSVAALGALKPGLGEGEALQLVKAASARVAEARPATNAGWSVRFEDPREAYLGDARIFLLLLAAAVGLVLLIACANVANLLLARASTRQRELAVRAALGAGRGRLVRQMLTESLLLAGAGSALGLLLARWGVDLVVRLVPAERAAVIPGWASAALDGRGVLFTGALALLTTLVFGLLPALRASRVDPQGALKQAGRGGDPASGRLRGALVVAEVALSVVLLACAALLLQSLVHMQSAPAGFEPRGLLTLQLGLGGPRYAAPGARERLVEALLPRLEGLPGVERAGAASTLPLSNSWQSRGYNVGGRPLLPLTERPVVGFRQVSPGALETLGGRLVSGRLFAAGDRAGAPPVVLVNEALARSVFPGEDPLGKQLLLGPQNAPHAVVGVVADMRTRPGQALPQPELLLPLAQGGVGETVSLVVRVRGGEPLALAPQVRALLAELDPELPPSQVHAYQRVMEDALVGERVSGRLLGAFALVALVLAALGIYGVMSYSVSERTFEIGVRMALGARGGDVRRQVLGRSLRLAGLGVALGTVAALGLAHLIASVLVGVSPRDPLTYAAIAGALLAVALAAAYGPARRATRVDPAIALRAA
jgi:putative ABC transport system permease protein